ncbi:MAG: sigma 54-interacting transcriptional regulator [Syntrophaceticus sp.]|nr:sigma 54-interacting transcriptional regulator [Syntrophaceticus sp.]MDD4359244.1 sigma 54-interacting transcriptional regulator [Syntrophaceticus sp.]
MSADSKTDLQGLSIKNVFPWLESNNEKARQVEIVDKEKRVRKLNVMTKSYQSDSSNYTSIILRDVTRTVELRKEMEDIKEVYEYALECLFDGVIITDQEGKIVYINKAQEKIDNVTKGFACNKNAKEFFNLDDESSVLMQALITKKEISERHQYYINVVGQAVNIVTYGYPLRVDGKVVGAVAVCRDTTKVKDFAEKVIASYGQPDDQAARLAKFKGKSNKVKYYTFDDLIGNNAAFKEAIRWAQVAAETDSSVLIHGLTGTGKELFAQSIHSDSKRKNAPFIGINCAALPESLLESILFGTVKGAFTGATDRLGLLEQVNGGTLFLDELNSMPLGLQAKLLRVLQDGRFRRVGGTEDIKVNIRVLSSLNADPNKAIADGVLRQDLFYRLAVVSIRIPPLEERKDDIPMLTSFFIGKHNFKLNKSVKNICPDVMECFLNYNWPGNVRELEHVLECAMVVMGDGSYIKMEHLPQHLIEGYAQQQDEHVQSGKTNNLVVLDRQLYKLHSNGNKGRGNPVLKHKLDSTEKDLIIDILGKTKGNVSKTARILGISRQSLQYRMKKYSIDREELSL